MDRVQNSQYDRKPLDSEGLFLDVHQIDALNQDAYLQRISDRNYAIEISESLLEKSRELGYLKGEADALRTIASATVRTDRAKSMEYVAQAIEIYEQIGDDFGHASALMPLFVHYHRFGWDEKAFALLQTALEKANRSGNTYIAAIALYNMGVQGEERKEDATAIDYFSRAAQLALISDNQHIYWSARSSKAILEAKTNDGEECVAVLMQACEELEKMGASAGAVDAFVNISKMHMGKGHLAEASRVLRKGRIFVSKHYEPEAMWNLLQQGGELAIAQGKWTRALRKFQRAYINSVGQPYRLAEAQSLERLAFVKQKLGLYEEALNHLRQHLELQNKLTNEQSERRLQDLQTYHRLELVQSEAQLAGRKNQELAAMNEQLHLALDRQSKMQKELMRIASTDELTGALNRRQLINDGTLEMERYRHMGAPFTISIIDIDHFKSINDTFGHGVGDEILRRLTQTCTSELRKFDVFGRLGGEEFCILHHDTDIQGATCAVQRFMKAIQDMDVADIIGDRQVTVSMGVAEIHRDNHTFYDLLHDADMALYEAKRSGRNAFRCHNSRVLEAA